VKVRKPADICLPHRGRGRQYRRVSIQTQCAHGRVCRRHPGYLVSKDTGWRASVRPAFGGVAFPENHRGVPLSICILVNQHRRHVSNCVKNKCLL